MKELKEELHSDISRIKQVFLYTLFFCLAAHAYAYFHLMPSHDSSGVFLQDASSGYIQNGRFMLPLYYALRGVYHAPWLIGMLSILYLAGSSYLVASMLNIRKPLLLAALCGVFATNLAVTATNATYLYASDPYLLSLFFSCAGAWMWQRFPKRGFLFSIPLFVMCIGLYQAYIDVAIGLLLLLLIQKLSEGQRVASLWKWALRCALSLLAGMVMWYCLTILIQRLTGTAMSTGYNRPDAILETGLLSKVKSIPRTYRGFLGFFFDLQHSYNSVFSFICTFLIMAAGAAAWLLLLRQRHIRGLELAALLACAAILPLGLGLMYILTNWVHELMIFSFFLVYVLFLLPFQEEQTVAALPARAGSILRKTVLCLLALVLVRSIVCANGIYFHKQLLSDSADMYAYSILTEMEKTEGYEAGVTPVAVIGDFRNSKLARQTDDFPFDADIVGAHSTSRNAFSYLTTFRAFCRTKLGQEINLVTDQGALTEYTIWRDVRRMPVYPQDGFCQIIKGVMIVKLENLL